MTNKKPIDQEFIGIVNSHKFAPTLRFIVFKLDNRIVFPDPHLGEPDGLFAVGGDLSAERLLLAYSNGIFPWYSFRHEDILWFCPMERFVIFPNRIRISHSMRTLMNKRTLHCTVNKCFSAVIVGCSKVCGRDKQDGAWLGPNIIEAYTRLHQLGFAASIETWQDERLVGGLYGVTIGRAFFGESMFSLEPNASKMALIFLALLMAEKDGLFIDCQFETEHLKSMGGKTISYDEYMAMLKNEET